jgi:RimJ/RimL family protein N-acetyltransferase
MTSEVSLRDVTEDDLPIFFEHQADPEANQMAAFPARDENAFMVHWTKILDDKNIIKQAIFFDGRVAGNIVCFEMCGKREVGYWIGKEYWGKGIATRALSLFLEYVKTRPLYAHVAKHNIASYRVLEKCGFAVIGEDSQSFNPGGAEVKEFILILGVAENKETPLKALRE